MATEGTEPAFGLPPESRGEAPALGRMVGRRVVVVGAGQTDYGIPDQPVGNGRALSLLLAREGAKVVAVDSNTAAADATVELIEAAGGDATAVTADVAEPGDVDAMVEARARAGSEASTASRTTSGFRESPGSRRRRRRRGTAPSP